MTDLIQWLNSNSGALSLVFSLVVAGATVVYALLTWQLVTETRLLRKAQTEPRVLVLTEPNPASINFIDLLIRNAGSAPATNIRLILDQDFETGVDKYLSRLGVFQHGLTHLAPSQEMRLPFTSATDPVHEKHGGLMMRRFTITVTYVDPTGNTVTQMFPITFDYYAGMTAFNRPEYTSAQALRKMEESLHKIQTGWSRIGVDVFTESDRKREFEARHEHIEAARQAALQASVDSTGSDHGTAPEAESSTGHDQTMSAATPAVHAVDQPHTPQVPEDGGIPHSDASPPGPHNSQRQAIEHEAQVDEGTPATT